jgi:peptidoglycan/xylan/chitin deacetylase (PgdA/CDA1 family)
MDGDGVRRVLKGAFANVMHYSRARRALNRVRRQQAGGRRVLILGYHRVVDDFEHESARGIPGTLISKKTFRRQLEDAYAAGYAFARLPDAALVLSGHKAVKHDLVVVTFDDGYRDVFRHAFPVLLEMGIPAMVYVPSDCVGTKRRLDHDRLFHLLRGCHAQKERFLGPLTPFGAAELWNEVANGTVPLSAALDDFIARHPSDSLKRVIEAFEQRVGARAEGPPMGGELMDWDEARKMARAGIDFGAHTKDHRVLTLEPVDVVDRQVKECKEKIEAELDVRVDSFAYCNGWYSDPVIRSLVRNGFRTAVTTEDELNRIGGDPFTLKRKVMWENFSLGAMGGYSSPLTSCHLDDVFGLLNVNHPVRGRRAQADLEGAG